MRAVAAAHLRYLLRARSVLATLALTAGAVLLVGLIALHDLEGRAHVAAGLLWLVVGLGGLFAQARVTGAEADAGLEGLLLAPLPRRDLFLARVVAAWPLVLGMGVLTWAALVALFPDLEGLRSLALVPGLLVGTAGLTVVGALGAWASLGSRAGELLGPVLAVPLSAPLLIASVHATLTAIETGAGWDPSLTFALGYDLAVGALSYLIAQVLVEVP